MLVMGFTGDKALKFKAKFICAFDMMENQLVKLQTNKNNEMWLGVREQSKQLRRKETDIIKEFVEYATKQGSKNAQFYYKHITNAVYGCLQLIQYKKPKLRETLDMFELGQLMVAENVAKQSLIKHMNEKAHYKEIFLLVKQDLEKFAEASFLTPSQLLN
jgi:hypothetical protein